MSYFDSNFSAFLKFEIVLIAQKFCFLWNSQNFRFEGCYKWRLMKFVRNSDQPLDDVPSHFCYSYFFFKLFLFYLFRDLPLITSFLIPLPTIHYLPSKIHHLWSSLNQQKRNLPTAEKQTVCLFMSEFTTNFVDVFLRLFSSDNHETVTE